MKQYRKTIEVDNVKYFLVDGEIGAKDLYYYDQDETINKVGNTENFDSVEDELNHINANGSYQKVIPVK